MGAEDAPNYWAWSPHSLLSPSLSALSPLLLARWDRGPRELDVGGIDSAPSLSLASTDPGSQLRAPPHRAAGGGQGAKVARHLRVGWGHPWGFLGAAQHSGGGPGLDNLSGEKGVGSLHGRLN